MLAKCANPACANRFHYLREGKLFMVEVDAETGAVPAGPYLVNDRKRPHRVEHYWLCDICVKTMTLAVDPQQGVIAVPTVRRAAAS